MTKICNMKRDDWDMRITIMLWAYLTTWKTLIGHTPFKLVYGQEVVVPMKYIVPSLRITYFMGMSNQAREFSPLI